MPRFPGVAPGTLGAWVMVLARLAGNATGSDNAGISRTVIDRAPARLEKEYVQAFFYRCAVTRNGESQCVKWRRPAFSPGAADDRGWAGLT